MSYTESAALAKEQEEALLYRAMQTDIVAQVHAPARRGAGRSRRHADPQRAARRPPASGASRRSTRVWGDEPLLAQEAGDAIRAAARAAGCSERQVHTVAGAHFDWSGVLGAAQAMSLFADRQLIEIRIPSGKPGKDGSEALQRYCETAIAGSGRDVLTLVQLPRLDRHAAIERLVRRARRAPASTLRIDPVERKALPRLDRAAPGRAGPARRRRRGGQQHARLLRRPRRGQPARRAPGNAEARPALPAGRAELRADRGGGAQRRPLRRVQARRGGARRPGRARAAHARRPARPRARRRCWCTGRWPRTSAP